MKREKEKVGVSVKKDDKTAGKTLPLPNTPFNNGQIKNTLKTYVICVDARQERVSNQ